MAALWTLVAALAVPTPSIAQPGQSPYGAAEVGMGVWQGQLALSGSLGVGLASSWVGVTLSPLAGLMRAGEAEHRYVEERRGLETVCVDTRSGTTYPESFCHVLGSVVIWTPSVELHLSCEPLGAPFWFGVGVRAHTEDPLMWSVSYVHPSDDLGKIRVRFLYSGTAWHLAFGVAGPRL